MTAAEYFEELNIKKFVVEMNYSYEYIKLLKCQADKAFSELLKMEVK